MLAYVWTSLENEGVMLAGGMISSAKTQPYQIVNHCETASVNFTLVSTNPFMMSCSAFVAKMYAWLVMVPLSHIQNVLLEDSIGMLYLLYNDVTSLDRAGAISRSTSSEFKRKVIPSKSLFILHIYHGFSRISRSSSRRKYRRPW